jgi:hypothetical protein
VRPSLLPDYQALHAQGKFPGLSIRAHLIAITELVMASGAKTLLDFGCGAGRQYEEECYHVLWGFMPTLYDPAVKAYSKKPTGRFDGVICTDVLEHVPERELDHVIADLVGYARKWCFISVCCRPAKGNKRLLDGRNVHVTIKPPDWWREKLAAAFAGKADLHLAFNP